MTIFGLEIELSAVVLGLINGMVYGILAVGLVLVYRSSRVINFAHGQIGAFGAAIMGIAALRWGLPYYVAFAIAVALGAVVSMGVEVAVVRRLREAPLVMTIVATAGVADLLAALALSINPQSRLGDAFPKPPGFPEFAVGQLRVNQASSALLFVCPLLVAGLAVFFRYTRFGLAIRGSAVNPASATLSGVSAHRMNSFAWGLAGAVSAFTAILVVPTRGIGDSASFGPSLLLLALVGAVVARMQSLPRALAGGVVVGVIESVMTWNYPRSGPTELVLFVVLLGALLLQHKEGTRERDQGSYTAIQPWRSLPPAVRELVAIRRMPTVLLTVAGVLAVGLAGVVTNRTAVVLIGLIAFAIVGLGIVIVTGLGGQVSLGQFGIAAVGGTVAHHLSDATGNYAIAFIGAGLAATAASVLVGLPALRLRGLMLAVTSLAFARVALTWMLPQSWMLGDGVSPARPGFGTLIFDSSRSYYLFSLAVLAIALLIASNYRRSGLGRRLAAVRDNEDAARSFSIRATRDKLLGFGIAGFLTGLGGALYVHSLTFVTADAFPLSASINIVALTALGGIGVLAGPIIGALYIVALPAFVQLDAATVAATSLGWLLLVVNFPGGLAQVLRPIREAAVGWVAARGGVDYRALASERGAGGRVESKALPEIGLGRSGASPAGDGRVLLEARGMTKHFGAVRAVDGVDLQVREGEILGLIGPNGAGKTTLFELLGGFSRPDGGTLAFDGNDISGLSAEARARLGLVRSFQDSMLFPTMTVFEALELAQERVAPTRFFPAMIGRRAQDRRKQERALELATLMGLVSYGDHLVAELSTGTRRIVELACLVALEPRLVLLDEPSSGIAQSETAALAEVIVGVKEHLGATVVLIEHDMGLISKVSDRMIAMVTGRVICEGTPGEVLADPEVARSYLGGDVAVAPQQRIDLTADDARCGAQTRKGTQCTRRARDGGLCGIHADRAVPA